MGRLSALLFTQSSPLRYNFVHTSMTIKMITQISSSAVAAISISNHVKLPMHVLQTVNIIEPAAL